MEAKFIGFSPPKDISNLKSSVPWMPITLALIPYSPVNQPAGYITTMGSANLSLATISPSGIQYVSGIHIFRRELNLSGAIDVDWYFAGSPSIYGYPIYKETPQEHHLKSTDALINSLDQEWKNKIIRELS